MTGVGVYPPRSSIIASTSLAANTSSALVRAGSESACVSMPTNSGPVMPLRLMTDCLADRQDMRLIEGVVQGGPTMTRRAERNALRRHRRVRGADKIRCHQPRHID